MGPRGEGKSDSGIMAMSYHASLQDKKYKPIPWAIVRDTWKNLERTTLRSFLFPSEKSFMAQIRSRLRMRDGGRFLELPGVWTAFLFGVDTPDDLNQLQSMQLGGLWIEEAAPAMQEEIGRGVAEEVWSIGITSLRHPLMSENASGWLKEVCLPVLWQTGLPVLVRTQAGGNNGGLGLLNPKEIKEGLLLGALTRDPEGGLVIRNRRAQLTQNYPSEDHWSWMRFHEDPTPDRALFRIPRGENIYVDDQYRETMKRALENRPDLLDRLVIGRPAHVQVGEKVTPEYNESLHRSKENLNPMPQLTTFRFWDGGLSPSCVFAQLTSRGKFIVTDTLRGSNVGMKQFIGMFVKPLLAERYVKIDKWRDIGDPSLKERDQSDSTVTAAKIIEEELQTTFEAGIASWQSRLEAMRELLSRLVDGEPMFVVSKHERILHRALSGGWHYHRDSAGRVLRDLPVKDVHCVDEKTECLTVDGWKNYNGIKLGQKIYGYDFKSGDLTLDEIKDVHYYEGNHPVLSFKNLQMDMVCTPKHNCVMARRTRNHNGTENFYPPAFVLAQNIHTGHQHLRVAPISQYVRRPKDKEYSNEFIRLCAWVMTEGTYRDTGQIWISQSFCANPEYCEQIKRLIKVFPNTYFRTEKKGSRPMLNAILKWEIAYLIKKLMPDKYPSPEFISQMTNSQKRLFLFEAIKGDGDNPIVLPDIRNISRLRDFWHQDTTPRIANGNKGESDAIQHIATLVGIRSILHEKKGRGCSHVSLTKLGQYSHYKEKPVRGEVNGIWCPETITHTWIARRNGQVFITGNSHPSDALSHGIAKIFRYQNEAKIKLPASRKNIAIGSSVQPLFVSGR